LHKDEAFFHKFRRNKNVKACFCMDHSLTGKLFLPELPGAKIKNGGVF
jgi:hypothetical protein